MSYSFNSDPRAELPRILAPQGHLTTARPAIEWESALHHADSDEREVELRLTLLPDPDSVPLARVGPIRNSAPRLPSGTLQIPAEQVVWLWLRERQTASQPWTSWNPLPTPLFFRPLPDGPRRVWVYDLRPTYALAPPRAFEEAHLVAALQGIVNREHPRLFLRFLPIDSWWLDALRESEGWLRNSELIEITTPEELIACFRDDIKGVVVWDSAVPATSNVASTIAGVEGLLPVCEDTATDSLWQRLVCAGPRLSVRRDLRGLFTGKGTLPDSDTHSTGSAKCDAYLWAMEQFLATGRCDPTQQGYFLDAWWIRDPAPGKDFSNHTLTNHDYIISRRGFFWDLDVWPDEAPVDDPAQRPGTDRETLLKILHCARRQTAGRAMICIAGFNPWAFKYTDYPGAGGTHDGVQTEWETVKIASEFDALIDADALHIAGMANASFYRHFPLPDYLVQGPAPTPTSLRRRGCMDKQGYVIPRNYILHYVGDYDSAAWTLTQLTPRWNTPERGTTPLSWAVNPNLAERAAPVFEYLYRTRTARDSFQAGDSGAGYVNPTGLLPPRTLSGLDSGAALWKRHCAAFYRRHNLTVTGFIINARSGRMTPEAERMFADFSPDGIVVRDPHAGIHLEGNLPVIPMRNEGLPAPNAVESARILLNYEGPADGGHPTFLTCRSVIARPEFYKEIDDYLAAHRPGNRFLILDPREFFYLLRVWLGGENTQRATFLFDTLPRPISGAGAVSFDVGIRNDGWDTWDCAGPGAVSLAVEFTHDGERHSPARFALPHPVAPGAAAVVSLEVFIPVEGESSGFLRIELLRGNAEWFEGKGTLSLLLPVPFPEKVL